MKIEKGKWGCELYFPEKKGNKVYAVDVYYTLAKCFRVEAKSEKEAERIVDEKMREAFGHAVGREAADTAADMGFEDCEEYELSVSGVGNKKGYIDYK